jgi:hypothetical protein
MRYATTNIGRPALTTQNVASMLAILGNAGWQRDLALPHERIADLRQPQRDLAAALTS